MNLLSETKYIIAGIAFLALAMPGSLKAMDPQFELSPQLVLSSKGKESTAKSPSALPGKKMSSRLPAETHRKHPKERQIKIVQKTAPALDSSIKSTESASPVLVGLLPAWETLVSSSTAEMPAGPLTFQSEAFSLTLDPSRYPMLPGQDGSTILLDPKGALPPLVRMLIQEKGRTLKVVGSPQQDSRLFLGELLGASGFYSVEEKPLLEFGSDPRLTVRADYKVEKNSDSLVKNDIVLVNASQRPSSPNLASFLKKEGVSIIEPFVRNQPVPTVPKHQLFSISPKGQPEMVDTLLGVLSLSFDTNRRVELFSVAESGFGLSVQADRYFEHAGKRYVITRFTGDPVAYTLLRLLETKGYRVVILEKQDGFRTVAEKVFSKMDLSVSYAPQLLVSDPEGRYSLELSAVLLENASKSGGAIVLTDRVLAPDMRAVLADYGYKIEER